MREDSQGALAGVQQSQDQLEGDIGDLEGQIQAQLQAQAAQASEPALPAGPVQGESSAGFIWPVNGPVVSGFGMRWGRMHTGIDIAVPAGVGIRAAAAGTVAIAGRTPAMGISRASATPAGCRRVMRTSRRLEFRLAKAWVRVT